MATPRVVVSAADLRPGDLVDFGGKYPRYWYVEWTRAHPRGGTSVGWERPVVGFATHRFAATYCADEVLLRVPRVIWRDDDQRLAR